MHATVQVTADSLTATCGLKEREAARTLKTDEKH